ncbi:uncharacterized protein LOC110232525 [Exaiptasia diaphana]|uniref:Uncharacterized protein n=1 Tax=Exaiptasia diaphana TaxID=2652724 RepID=A0A913WSF4_EXADI|nr:uncharacterized protein LOC110232525 [Exaiptasia diaphana]
MVCCNRTDTWAKSLVTRDGIDKLFVVQLNRKPDRCISEQYEILVNNKPVPHQLTPNFCSPLCGSGGVYEWEQDGHSFMLMYSRLGILRMMRGYRLFIDGIDVDTGLEFRAFFRQRGLLHIGFGLLMFVIGLALLLVYFFGTTNAAFMYSGISLTTFGVVHLFIGAITYFRNRRQPQDIPNNYYSMQA